MNNKKIKNIFESWGRNKQEIPLNNDILKREILSKIPVSFNRTVHVKRSPVVWLPFAFTAMAIIVIFINTTNYKTGMVSRQNSTQNEIQDGYLSAPDVYKTDVYVVPEHRETPISDNREFLKINYDTTLRTRNVIDLKNKVEMIVRSLNGRVDASSGGEKSGYVNFAIPKDKLEAFKIELKNLVGTKFYNEHINSQNFLPTKQIIERNQKQAEKILNDLQIERGQIVKNHNQVISIFQNNINSVNIEINSLNTEYQYANIVRRAEIINKISLLQEEINTIQTQISTENKNFQAKINSIDTRIKSTQENLKDIKLQDNNLIDNVATVNGTISLSWISVWEVADLYLPGPVLAWVFFLMAFLTFFWYRYSARSLYNSIDLS